MSKNNNNCGITALLIAVLGTLAGLYYVGFLPTPDEAQAMAQSFWKKEVKPDPEPSPPAPEPVPDPDPDPTPRPDTAPVVSMVDVRPQDFLMENNVAPITSAQLAAYRPLLQWKIERMEDRIKRRTAEQQPTEVVAKAERSVLGWLKELVKPGAKPADLKILWEAEIALLYRVQRDGKLPEPAKSLLGWFRYFFRGGAFTGDAFEAIWDWEVLTEPTLP